MHGGGCKMIPAFLIGVVSAPLVGKVVKSLARGTVKTTVGIGLQAKKLAAETAEDSRDLSAETSAEMAPAGAPTSSGVLVAAPKQTGVPGVAPKRPAEVGTSGVAPKPPADVTKPGVAPKRPGGDSGTTATKRS